MNSWMWYLTRSSGIVAAVLAVASLVLGLFFSARNTGNRKKPNWWLSLHNYLGGLTLGFVGFHMLVSFLNSEAGLRLVDLFVPNTTTGWPIGWGVIGTWLFVLVVIPSIARIRRHLPRKAWHLVHLLSIPAVGLTIVHALQSGSDSWEEWFTTGAAVIAGTSIYPLSVRLLSLAQRRRTIAAA